MKSTAVICALISVSISMALAVSCAGTDEKQHDDIGIVVLDPGHFHASLVLKNPLEGVSDTIAVYAPEGPEVERFLADVESYNTRKETPTAWKIELYTGADYFERMLSDAGGDVVVLAGNNQKKTEYILGAVESGRNVLSDKPMAINGEDFEMLAKACRVAAEKGLTVYDIMTERYDVLDMVMRELVNDKALFGEMLAGSADQPAITMLSIHNFFKTVSGAPLTRPVWYYDVEQQGEGIVDVTTHLIDLASWLAFPDEAVRYPGDVEVTDATHFPTRISLEEYTRSTGAESFPPFLDKYVKDGALEVMANGTLDYTIKGVHVGMKVVWNYSSPDDADRFSSVIKGSKARVDVIQDDTTGFVKQLYVRCVPGSDPAELERQLTASVEKLREQWPALSIVENAPGLWLIDIPLEARTGHEAHFSLVAGKFLDYVRGGDCPEWETGNMLSKYYITTTAVEMANSK